MALTVITATPVWLNNAIKKAIDDKKIVTWEYDKDGDFIHTAAQWYKKAWLRPATGTGELTLTLLVSESAEEPDAVAGVYQGRFIEMLITHFKKDFSSVKVTP